MPFEAETRRCRAAQLHWQTKSVRKRLTFVRKLRPLLVERRDALCAAVAADVSRDPGEVAGTDLLPSADIAKYLTNYATSILAPRKATRPLWLLDCQETVYRRPFGVVGVIGTWNYPIYLTLGAIVPALVAGNGVLWKPSENTPQTAEALNALLLDAGAPCDLLVKLPVDRAAGPQLCEANIDYLHFTGSDAVGRRIASRLGDRLIPSTLELSGCDAFIVMADAALDLAVRTAWYGLTLNNGQTCISARRAIVAKPLFEEFINRLVPLIENAKPRPLVTPGQSEQMKRILGEARNSGLRVITNDEQSPALIVNPPAGFSACREASFAPLLSVMPFESDDDLLAKIHTSPFGLSSAIFTADHVKARALAASIRAGSVILNDVIVPTANPGTPFGGRGASGWGSTKGAEGLLAMTVPQVVSRRRGSFRPHVDAAVTHDPAAADVMSGLLRLCHGSGCLERWRGFRQLLSGFRNRKTPS